MAKKFKPTGIVGKVVDDGKGDGWGVAIAVGLCILVAIGLLAG